MGDMGTTLMVHTHDICMDDAYVKWIADIKNRFKSAQIKAAIKINSEQLLFNWQLGRDLVEHNVEEKWGKGIVEQLSLDLQAAFPEAKGFSARNLWFMKQWYSFYAENRDIINRFAENEELLMVDNKKLNQVGSVISDEKLLVDQGRIAQEILKGNYDLGFVSLPKDYDEVALEDALEQRMTRCFEKKVIIRQLDC